MEITIRGYADSDIETMTHIWNEVVSEGIAFPQIEGLTASTAKAFFASQSFTGVAVVKDEVLGLYILHPNNIGRCGHIANASFAVISSARGLHIGEKLVSHCLEQARKIGFQLLQFNAVVRINFSAIHLYEKLGFIRLGMIPKGFLLKDGTYEDIILFYHTL
ncbi:GNAT family N-acetyltransferase [Acetobacterium bakii]|uniref:GCN5 family acetyltransferase n=1 Tax=Acetobacterium bakii TaxID=52689 RepID=A0A0L6TXE8_9FIRM|nr:GNAT family N-acetyltransferase [Acetobacterium bakii]KNZ40931.1 GCN5 family acetyltransferase [Acetobacterium bakii]